MQTIECPECAGEVELAEGLLLGEILECAECGVELEITAVSPVAVELAPEVEEDWGE